MMPKIDYSKIGLKVGLELHQQLDTSRKLYCHCPPIVRDDPPHGVFVRRLRPTQSEMGEVDPAALFEFQKHMLFYYEYYTDTTCLVEADEEPPHDMDPESIDICLTMAKFLDSVPVDEVHPMRKIVIDGSNTSGFQRTAVIALGGHISVNNRNIGIQTICLEEDAARKITEDEKHSSRTYRLDRLGIPLIEIATAPDIRTPTEAQEVALALGLLLRSTGRVKRGLGTIRQDVNVSIRDGAIIEIKGLQQLELLSKVVELEAIRQIQLLGIRDELARRGINESDLRLELIDITDVFIESASKLIRRALRAGHRVLALRLPGFAGLVGREVQPGRRLGTEFSDYAKFWGGVGGIFHTDELPKYGISQDEVERLRKKVGADSQDAVAIVADAETRARNALEAVFNRAIEALHGVPAETRVPLPDGTTKYARPRPGAERMYPETDVRPVKITAERLARIAKNMPETLQAKAKRFVRQYALSEELAAQITKSLNLDLFEKIVESCSVSPTLVAVTLENTLVSLHRDGVPTEQLSEDHLLSLFRYVEQGLVTPAAIPTILSYVAGHPSATIQDALDVTGVGVLDEDSVRAVVRRTVEERRDFVRSQGERAIGGIMGIVMKDLRGKADGKTVRQIVEQEVRRALVD
ncbi:MAG: Glu-tRNA(Gln) amidotransferase subunit GatE [Candidatus Thorarchaeota archaeon]